MSGFLFNIDEFGEDGNPPLSEEYNKDELKLIRNFEENPVATMTIVVNLNGEIKIPMLFHLIPIVYAKTKEEGKSKKKIIIEKGYGSVGSIYSAKYDNYIRGIDRTKSDKIFRNSISIELETSKKILNAKISSNTIQMCGASHKKDGEETANIIINLIYEIKEMLHYINDNQEKADNTINYILSVCKGSSVAREKLELFSDNMIITHKIKDYKFVKIDLNEEIDEEEIDMKILSFFARYDDYEYYYDFKEKIEWIMSVKNIAISNINNIDIQMVNLSMVKVNYKIGFNINRFLLALYLHKEDGIFAKFDNSCMQYVSIEIPCISKTKKTKNKNNKIDYHALMVYRSGSVTQSGQGGKAMEDAYIRFMRNVYKYKDSINTEEWTIFMKPEEIQPVTYKYDISTSSYKKYDNSSSVDIYDSDDNLSDMDNSDYEDEEEED